MPAPWLGGPFLGLYTPVECLHSNQLWRRRPRGHGACSWRPACWCFEEDCTRPPVL